MTQEPAIYAIVTTAASMAGVSEHVRLAPPFIAGGSIVRPEKSSKSIERNQELCDALSSHEVIYDRDGSGREFYRISTTASDPITEKKCSATLAPYFPEARWIAVNRPKPDRRLDAAILAELRAIDLGRINKIRTVTNSKGELLWIRIYIRPNWMEAMLLGNTPVDAEASVPWMVYNFSLQTAVSLR